MEITGSDKKEEDLYINKIGGIVKVYIVKDMEKVEVTFERVGNTFFQSRS